MTIEETITLWLSHHRPTTAESYRYPIRNFASLVGPALPITELTPVHLSKYAAVINNRDYKPGTIRKHIVTIKTFLNWCYKMRLLETKLSDFLHAPKTPRHIDRSAAMGDDDLTILLNYLASSAEINKVRDYALFQFIADTACRAGGAANLKLHDLKLEELEATVIEKGDKVRRVAYTENCAAALKRWLIRRPICDVDNVFISLRTKHQPITANYIGLILRRHAATIERDLGYSMKNRNPHSLRHRVGHKLFDERIAVPLISRALGHESIKTTLEHYAPDGWEEAADLLRLQAIKPTHTLEIKSKIQQLPDKKSGAN